MLRVLRKRHECKIVFTNHYGAFSADVTIDGCTVNTGRIESKRTVKEDECFVGVEKALKSCSMKLPDHVKFYEHLRHYVQWEIVQ